MACANNNQMGTPQSRRTHPFSGAQQRQLMLAVVVNPPDVHAPTAHHLSPHLSGHQKSGHYAFWASRTNLSTELMLSSGRSSCTISAQHALHPSFSSGTPRSLVFRARNPKRAHNFHGWTNVLHCITHFPFKGEHGTQSAIHQSHTTRPRMGHRSADKEQMPAPQLSLLDKARSLRHVLSAQGSDPLPYNTIAQGTTGRHG